MSDDTDDPKAPLPFDAAAMRRANAFAGVEVFTAGAIARAATVPPRACDLDEPFMAFPIGRPDKGGGETVIDVAGPPS